MSKLKIGKLGTMCIEFPCPGPRDEISGIRLGPAGERVDRGVSGERLLWERPKQTQFSEVSRVLELTRRMFGKCNWQPNLALSCLSLLPDCAQQF